jgi:hypothetical protein
MRRMMRVCLSKSPAAAWQQPQTGPWGDVNRCKLPSPLPQVESRCGEKPRIETPHPFRLPFDPLSFDEITARAFLLSSRRRPRLRRTLPMTLPLCLPRFPYPFHACRLLRGPLSQT